MIVSANKLERSCYICLDSFTVKNVNSHKIICDKCKAIRRNHLNRLKMKNKITLREDTLNYFDFEFLNIKNKKLITFQGETFNIAYKNKGGKKFESNFLALFDNVYKYKIMNLHKKEKSYEILSFIDNNTKWTQNDYFVKKLTVMLYAAGIIDIVDFEKGLIKSNYEVIDSFYTKPLKGDI